jgi:hypothetical protein
MEVRELTNGKIDVAGRRVQVEVVLEHLPPVQGFRHPMKLAGTYGSYPRPHIQQDLEGVGRQRGVDTREPRSRPAYLQMMAAQVVSQLAGHTLQCGEV